MGGAGRMGVWFTRYFSSRGFPTVISDVRAEEARSVASDLGAEMKETSISAVRDVDLVLICAPIVETPEIISEIAPHMRKGAVLAEVSSVKERVVKALREAASIGVQPLCIHPMFGPTAESMKDETIAVIPVIEVDGETDLAASLFDEAKIVVVEQEEHDRLMAIVLSLTYFMNLAFARVLREADIISVKRLAGTTFTVQLAVAESIVSEDPGLVASLLRDNRYTEGLLEGFISEAEIVRRLIEERSENFDCLYDSLRASFRRDPDYHEADERRRRAFEALRA